MRSLFPLVKSLLRKWMQDRDTAESESFGNRLDSALENFGTSVLTRRECEVLHMTMRGHSIKSMAERLDASVDTIKTHRKHIYTKLDITSQSELFYLFISALRHHAESDSDPLISLESGS
ncbi:helix-turn-helix domain-containing protein [Microbulbifer taiwanensis]|uniref:helix-turn-helix domain-containing protein n=1 Tax=Microbulbifer taiwanensis TaxID=986746 RepID=UPI003608B934